MIAVIESCRFFAKTPWCLRHQATRSSQGTQPQGCEKTGDIWPAPRWLKFSSQWGLIASEYLTATVVCGANHFLIWFDFSNRWLIAFMIDYDFYLKKNHEISGIAILMAMKPRGHPGHPGHFWTKWGVSRVSVAAREPSQIWTLDDHGMCIDLLNLFVTQKKKSWFSHRF